MGYKATYTICGSKGTGKTTSGFRFKDNILCLSYEGKADRIWKYIYQESPNIKIINAVELYDRTPERMVPTSRIAFDDIMRQIEENKDQHDWIMHDGIEKMHEIGEMCMRNEFKLKPFQGFAEKSYWKYRRVILANLHRKSLEAARKGVIYTTFLAYEEEIESGEIVRRKTVPKYFDAIEEETDVVFMTSIKQVNNETKFMLKVVTSKVPKWRTGDEIDVTMKVPQYDERGE